VHGREEKPKRGKGKSQKAGGARKRAFAQTRIKTGCRCTPASFQREKCRIWKIAGGRPLRGKRSSQKGVGCRQISGVNLAQGGIYPNELKKGKQDDSLMGSGVIRFKD